MSRLFSTLVVAMGLLVSVQVYSLSVQLQAHTEYMAANTAYCEFTTQVVNENFQLRRDVRTLSHALNQIVKGLQAYGIDAKTLIQPPKQPTPASKDKTA